MSGRGRRILVVEDSSTQAAELRILLESEDHAVHVCGCLAEAQERLRGDTWDVVLLDLILPDASGLDGVLALTTEFRQVPVIVLTAVTDAETAVSAVKRGAQDYLIKGEYDPTLLRRSIAYALERHRIRLELEKLTEQLRHRNQQLRALNEEKNRFLGMAAHDLRNPLAVCLSFSKLLLDERKPRSDPERRRFLGIIRKNSEFMLELINDLLDISQIEAGKLVLTRVSRDLAAVVAENVALNHALADAKGIRLALVSPPPLPPVSIDEGKIAQVLNNLISNALKFSHGGTTVSVSLGKEDGWVAVRVADQGQGIPADEIDRLFNPFSRTSVQSTDGEKSTGLGLAIVRKIVQAHGGEIRVRSQVGRGTTFEVLLPQEEAPGAGAGG